MTSLTGLRTERKRAHDDSSARESDADASMWRHVTSPRLVKTATRPSIASPPGTNPQQGWPVLKNDYFYNECNNLFHQYLEQLNQQHLAFYKTYPDADPYWMQCEYVRQVNKYKELYQKPFTGLVLTCGSNDVDQLGSYGDTSVPRQLRVEQWKQDPPVKIHCGSTHNVVLGLHGHAYTFGNSDQGQLGRDGGDIDGNLQVTGFVPSKHAIVKTSLPADLENEDGCIIKAVGGNLQTLFLTIHGNVYTVGGIRDYDDKLLCEPRPPDDGIMPDDKKWPRGSNRKPTHLYEMPGKVKDISSGTLMSAALLNDGTVVTWGTGTRGELGRPVPSEIKGPDGKFHVESLRETFLKPHPVHFAGSPSKMSVISFACGSGHLMVVAREEGSIETTVYGTGLNKEGQLGLGDFEDRKILTPLEYSRKLMIANVKAGLKHTLALDLSGLRLYACGSSLSGQIGITNGEPDKNKPEENEVNKLVPVPFPSKDLVFEEIECGEDHNLAIAKASGGIGQVYTWGFGDPSGALGHGTEVNEYRPKKLEFRRRDGSTINGVFRGVSGGAQHSAMLFTPSKKK